MDTAALDTLGPDASVLYEPELVDDRQALLQAVSDADGLIVRNRTQVDTALLDAAPSLRVVGRLGVGLDNIDSGACAARDVTVCPAIGANAASVAEYVLTSALLLLRPAYDLNARMLAGEWPRADAVGAELGGRTLGLIGFGNIARVTAAKAQALGMNVIAHDPLVPADDPAWGAAKSAPFETVIATADVISLHIPLTDATRHLIDANAIAAMKPEAILINTARGGIVDEAALAAALHAGKLAGAALDVFETEPLTQDQAQVFAGLGNILLTPHIAGVTHESNARVSRVTVDNVKRALGLE